MLTTNPVQHTFKQHKEKFKKAITGVSLTGKTAVKQVLKHTSAKSYHNGPRCKI